MHYFYYIYIIASAVLVLICDNFFEVFSQSYSFWLVPLLLILLFVAFVILQVLLLVVMVYSTSLKKEAKKCSKFFRELTAATIQLFVFLTGIKISTAGTEAKLDESKHYLFVCNHQHDLDPVIIYNTFPNSEIGFIGKKEIYKKMPFIARGMHKINSLPIDRENDRAAAKTIVKAVKLLKNDIASIALFPEGYTSRTGELLPFRNGSLKVAMKAQAPIAVCVLNNTRSIVKNLFRRKTVVEFRLLDIITPEQYENLTSTQLGDMIYEQMKKALAEIS